MIAKNHIVSLITLSLFAMASCQAMAVGACRDLLRGRPIVQLNVWRYYGQEDFGSASHISLSRDGQTPAYRIEHMGLADSTGSYRPLGFASQLNYELPYRGFINPLRAEMESGAKGETVYERIQYYSLKLMEKIKYLPGQGREEQVKNSLLLQPNRVTLFEATEQKRGSELMAEYGAIPDSARLDTNANSWSTFMGQFDFMDEEPPAPQDPVYEVKVGVSWLISGQDLQQRFELPLVTKTISNPLDRARYPIVWEIGRAGQTKDAAFEETLRASAYAANVELILMGGRIEDAYVFGHSLDAMHTRLYRSKFGMTPFATYSDNPKESSLVGTLSEFTQRYPLQSYSPTVAMIMDASKGSLLPRDALKWILDTRAARTFFLSSAKNEIVQIRDFSNAQFPSLKAQLDRLVMPPFDRENLLRTLWTFEPIYEFRDTIGDYAKASQTFTSAHIHGNRVHSDKQPHDRNGLQRLRDFLTQQNAVEVFTESSVPVITALTETYRQLAAKLFRAGISDPGEWMNKAQIHFCMTSEEGRQLQALYDLKPAARWQIDRVELVSTAPQVFGHSFNEVVVPGIHIESLCFTSYQIAELSKASGNIRDHLKIGEEHMRRFLADPQLYGP